MESAADVIVIGAGAAGLMAARELSRAGLSVELLEARATLGGRIFTHPRPDWPIPIELGPEFVHGRVKVTLELAKELGVELQKLGDTHHLKHAGHLIHEDTFWERMARVLEKRDRGAPDESAEAFLVHAGIAEDDAEFFRMMVEGYHAAPLSDVSIESIAEDASASGEAEDDEQFRVIPGYGELVERLVRSLDSSRVRIRTSAPVRRVEWSPGAVAVSLDGAGGGSRIVRAPRAVITASTAVLEAGEIGFAPELTEKRAALRLLPLGHVVKLVLLFDGEFWQSTAPDLQFAHAANEPFPTFWRRSSGTHHQFIAWAGGPKAFALAGKSEEELASLAVRTLARIIGIDADVVRAALVGVAHRDFVGDPFVRGAYSYARPGGNDARASLATPVENTLFFAGEATDHEHSGTVAGAFLSGQRAARQILGSLWAPR